MICEKSRIFFAVSSFFPTFANARDAKAVPGCRQKKVLLAAMPMKQKMYFALLSATLLLAFSCTSHDGVAPVASDRADTIYTEAKAMNIHRIEPERALRVIDSAVIVGNIKPIRGEYLKAVTYYGGLGNYMLARQLCLDLIEKRDEIRDSLLLERIYLLLTSIEMTSGNYAALINYATEASRLAHELDMPEEVGSMEGFVAYAMARTGKSDEGIERLRTVVGEMRTIESFKGVSAYHSTAKRLLHILLDNDRLPEMLPVCEAVLQRIDELGQHPERFSDINQGFDVAEYVDMARGQILAFMAVSYARQAFDAGNSSLPELRSTLMRKAREADAEIQRTRWSKSVDCDKMMSSAYHYMGDFKRFYQAMDRMEATYHDTINPNYIICLMQRSEAGEIQGRHAEALHYLQRVIVVRDSLDNRLQSEQLNELATVYHLQEEKLARQKAEVDARLLRRATFATVIFLLLAVGFAVYFFYKRRETMNKNRALVRMIDEMHDSGVECRVENGEYATAIPPDDEAAAANSTLSTLDSTLENAAANSKLYALYAKLYAMIHNEQLYRDGTLDRDTVCQRLGIDRHVLNQLLNTYAEGLSLPAYINKVRLDVAYELLRDKPEKSIADIAAEVGFTPQNFRLQFKKRYGITPIEYRQSR